MSAHITWEDLKNEYLLNNGPGKLWIDELKRACRVRIRQKRNLNLPAEIFGFVDWDVDDLAQTVLVDRLLGRGQAQYIFDTVDNVDYARKLISNEVSFTLEDRRVPNQVDNVWHNLEPKLSLIGWQPGVSLENPEIDDIEAQINEMARKVLNLKRLRNRGQQRHSPLFSSETLSNFAELIVQEHPQVNGQMIQKAIRIALSKISPRVSMEAVGSTQEDFGAVTGSQALTWKDDLGSKEGMEEQAIQLIEALGPSGCEICFQIASNATQSEIASILGVSRPTAIKRIAETEELMLKTLKSLELSDEENVKILESFFALLGAGISEGAFVK